MRPEELYLTDIAEAADAIQRFVEGIEREDFFHDALHFVERAGSYLREADML